MADSPSAPDPDALDGMEELLRGALAGHSFIIRIKAVGTLETTGTLSGDGTEAEYILPITRFLDRPIDLGPPFVTEIALAQSCVLWVFCD